MNSLYYKDQGRGPILIFLHGFCETHRIWDDLVTELSQNFRVITLDLPGFGKSPILKRPFSIKEVGHSVVALLIEIGVQKCVIIGHSLGGYVVLAAAEERPDLFLGLCLFHSTAQADSEEKKINRNRVIEFVKKNGVHPFIATFVPGLFFQREHQKIEKVYRIALKTSKKAILDYSQAMRDRPDMINFLERFQNKTLFIAGEQDSIISVAVLKEQSKVARAGKLEVLAKTGHMGMFEDKDETVRVLNGYAKACFSLNSI